MNLRGMVPPDADSDVSQIRFAVVYVPGRDRSRFSANCVELAGSAAEARATADPSQRRFPARVLGPSKSSEGQSMYYLVEWLE